MGSQLTRTGASMGTPYYISPEQAHGDSDAEIPAATGLGSAEGHEPGPVLLQSNVGKARFRNLWIIPLGER
jgi:hypothetical protein